MKNIPTTPLVVKAIKEVHDNIEVFAHPAQSYIIVAAVHKEYSCNKLSQISCKDGIPIGGYVYDSLNESYHIRCSDYLSLGFVPISFVIRVKGVNDWLTKIPIPEKVLKKCFSNLQKKELKNFSNQFKSEEYDLQFVQMVDPFS